MSYEAEYPWLSLDLGVGFHVCTIRLKVQTHLGKSLVTQ